MIGGGIMYNTSNMCLVINPTTEHFARFKKFSENIRHVEKCRHCAIFTQFQFQDQQYDEILKIKYENATKF